MAKQNHSDNGHLSRPVWRGHISFSLVQIPVTLQSAESRYDLHFRLLDSRNRARIRYERINEVTGEEVPWKDVVKAYEFDDENYVVLSDDDFTRAAVKATKTIEIERFVDSKQIGLMYYDRPYYVFPGKDGERGYALLRDALEATGKTGVARVVIRTREYLSAVTVQGPALVLILLRFAQEIRKPQVDALPPANPKLLKIGPQEREMAAQLVESMSGPWKPEQYRDEYREVLMKWIEKKARSGGKMPVPEADEAEEAPRRIVSITDLLQKSLQREAKTEKRRAGPRRASPRGTRPLRRRSG